MHGLIGSWRPTQYALFILRGDKNHVLTRVIIEIALHLYLAMSAIAVGYHWANVRFIRKVHPHKYDFHTTGFVENTNIAVTQSFSGHQ